MSELKISEEASRAAKELHNQFKGCGPYSFPPITQKATIIQLAMNSVVEPRDKRIAELELKVADRNEWQDVAMKVSAQRDELQKQIDLDTGNITRMQEAGFKAEERIKQLERQVLELREALQWFISQRLNELEK